MTALREDAARLWCRILRADPEAIFGTEASRLSQRNWADRLPQPGYMGLRYRPGGLVFVSMNPGAGPQDGLGGDDQRQYVALQHLRDTDEAAAETAFDQLTQVLAEIMPGWKIHHNFVAPVLRAAGVDFSQVAYVNLLKWRTAASSGLARLYALSWDHHTRDQLELLAPSRVIAIGSDAGRAFQRHFTGAVDFDFIPRAIGNNVGPAGREALARIARVSAMNPCCLEDLNGWLEAEAGSSVPEPYRRVLLEVNANLDSFVKWPQRAELLWDGCKRTVKYHDYSDVLKTLFRQQNVVCDARSNGPAVMAYLVAGGQRPRRNGQNEWTIHHLYDGKFPYPSSKGQSLRAVLDGRHFTQSAGLVAIHPVADALADEFAMFAWRLRAEAFLRFGYDLEGAFSDTQDQYGFAGRSPVKVWATAAGF